MYMTGAVPARFLVLVSHLVLTVVVLLARDDNILACLRRNYSEEEYASLDVGIIVGTSLSLGLFLMEFIAFIWAFSITQQWQNLFSILCHSTGAVTLSFFVLDGWCSSFYWYVFVFCCIPPAITELLVWMCNALVKKHF